MNAGMMTIRASEGTLSEQAPGLLTIAKEGKTGKRYVRMIISSRLQHYITCLSNGPTLSFCDKRYSLVKEVVVFRGAVTRNSRAQSSPWLSAPFVCVLSPPLPHVFFKIISFILSF